MIVEIKAQFSCDDCGTEFFVSIDPGFVHSPGWSVFDVAVDAIRGGFGYEDATDHRAGATGSVGDDGRHYCARCTTKRDGRRPRKHSDGDLPDEVGCRPKTPVGSLNKGAHGECAKCGEPLAAGNSLGIMCADCRKDWIANG